MEASVAVLPRLPPRLAQTYRAEIQRPADALAAGPDGQEALDAIQCLIERVVITPVQTGKGFEIELVGEIAAMIALGAGLPLATLGASGPGLFESSIKVVAGTRNRLDLLLAG